MSLSNPLLIEKREELLEAARNHGGANLRVFGSQSRGDAGPDSDFDFLVDRGPTRRPFFPGGLQSALEEILECKVDVVTESSLHPKLRDRVLEEALPL